MTINIEIHSFQTASDKYTLNDDQMSRTKNLSHNAHIVNLIKRFFNSHARNLLTAVVLLEYKQDRN